MKLPEISHSKQAISEVIFCLLIGIIITFLRVPTWRNEQSNVDEAQWLAGCVTLDAGYGFWRVDATTSGPLVVQFLWIWTRLLGSHSFLTAKLLTTTVWIVASILGYLSIRMYCEKVIARAIILPTVFTVALFRGGDFTAYNGEQLPILLLSVAAFLLLKIHLSNQISPQLLASLLGLVLGILPYSKLQAIPMGFLLGVFGIWTLWRTKALFLLLSTTAAAGLLPLGWLAYRHQLHDFWVSYILENLQYASTHSPLPFIKRLYAFPFVWLTISDCRALVVCSLLTIATSGVVVWRQLRRGLLTDNSVLAAAILFLAVAGYCVAQPGTFFEHYYLFMFHPLLLCVAAFFQTSLQGLKLGSQRRWAGLWMIAVLCAVTLSQLERAENPGTDYRWPELQPPPANSVATVLMRNSDAQSRLAIWGWACHLHVQTGIPQATIEGHTFRQIMKGPYQDYFLSRFIRQLEANRAHLIFVDATDSGESKYFKDPQYGHQHYPKLHAFVQKHLELITIEHGCRIYRSRGGLNP